MAGAAALRQVGLAGGVIGVTGQAGLESAGRVHVAVDGAIPGDPGLARGAAAQVAQSFRRLGLRRTLEQLEGEFAVAVFDEDSGDVWLARDRLGVQAALLLAARRVVAFASPAWRPPRAAAGAAQRSTGGAWPSSRARTTARSTTTPRHRRSRPSSSCPPARSPAEPAARRSPSATGHWKTAATSRPTRSRWRERYRELLLDAVGQRVADRRPLGVHAVGRHGLARRCWRRGRDHRGAAAGVLDRLHRHDLRRVGRDPDSCSTTTVAHGTRRRIGTSIVVRDRRADGARSRRAGGDRDVAVAFPAVRARGQGDGLRRRCSAASAATSSTPASTSTSSFTSPICTRRRDAIELAA